VVSLVVGDRVSSDEGALVLENMLGRGAFGEVWKCRDIAKDVPRAVKIVRSQDAGSVADEIVKHRRAFDSVTAPDRDRARENHVPKFFFSAHGALEDANGECKGQVFGIVMQYIDGGSLAHALSTHGPMQYWMADFVMQDMVYALCRLGEAGIIHRDVKSANILINKRGECYLADFGTATFMEDIVEGHPMDVVGTPMYMAPEIVRSVPTKYDDRVDSWALGIVAYELMLGKTPWQMLGVSDHTELIFKELRMRDEMDDLIGALLPLHQGVLADMPMEQAVGAGVDRARQVLVDARAIAPRPRCSLGLRALPS